MEWKLRASAVKKRRGMIWVVVMLAVEAMFFVRWLFFGGPSIAWQIFAGLLLTLWVIQSMEEAFRRREEHRDFRMRDIETRLEALYKWGSIYSVAEEEEPKDSAQENENLDEVTRVKVAKYRESIESGEVDYSSHLGDTYWNLGISHYNSHTIEGYKKAIYWLRKASKLGYECDHILGDMYLKLGDYDKAMLWYRRIVKRGDKRAYRAESKIADMYAEGQGVRQNYAEAARWWSLAANHGHKFSNYDLGKLYASGAEGVPQNDGEAYFHLCIAASGDELGGLLQYLFPLREQVANQLSEWETSQQQKRALEWLETHSLR